MSETSPTEQVDGGPGSTDENVDLPDQNQNNQSADGQQTESVSGDTQTTDQDDNSQQGDSSSTDDDSSSSDDDDGLSKFAKAQGFDPENLTDGERKALKLAHDNQKAFRTKAQEDSDALKDTLVDTESVSDDELEDLDPTEAWQRKQDARFAQLEAKERSNEFFIKNPDAREFETEMAQLLVEEAKNNGVDAARYLSKDLNRVLVLAKAARGDSTEQARADGARAERERLRQRQEGSADGGQASNSHQAPKKLSRSDILEMDDKEYEKLRESGELDEIINRGDLY